MDSGSETPPYHKEEGNRKRKGKTISQRSKQYRARKKMYIENLQKKVEVLEQENTRLKDELESLKEPKQVFLSYLVLVYNH